MSDTPIDPVHALVADANDISNHKCRCQLSTLLQERVDELETELRVTKAQLAEGCSLLYEAKDWIEARMASDRAKEAKAAVKDMGF